MFQKILHVTVEDDVLVSVVEETYLAGSGMTISFNKGPVDEPQWSTPIPVEGWVVEKKVVYERPEESDAAL